MEIVSKCALAAAALALLLSLPNARAAASEASHPAYLTGFPDGTVRPEAPLTREQLAQALWRLLQEAARGDLTAPTCFFDVPPSRWSYEAVTAMVNLGVLYGTGDGAFSPEAGVSGPELAAALMRISASEEAAAAMPEVSAGWAAQALSFTEGDGWVMGFDGERFCPDKPLTRAEFAAIFNRLLGRAPRAVDDLMVGMPVWSDNADSTAKYFLAIQEAGTDHTACTADGGERWTGLG